MLDWDHNAYYHRLLLRQIPQHCRRVLDVGCGAGAFAARLARRSERVDALDRCAEMIEEARRHTPDNVNCVLADVLADPLPGKDYDAIFSISALHHVPLPEALDVLAAALRPGGTLAAVALPRPDLPHELPIDIVAAVAHRLLGAIFWVSRVLGSRSGFAKDSTHSTMPVVPDPPLTTRQVADQAAETLPGVRVRRLLFWRYLLVWHKPIACGQLTRGHDHPALEIGDLDDARRRIGSHICIVTVDRPTSRMDGDRGRNHHTSHRAHVLERRGCPGTGRHPARHRH